MQNHEGQNFTTTPQTQELSLTQITFESIRRGMAGKLLGADSVSERRNFLRNTAQAPELSLDTTETTVITWQAAKQLPELIAQFDELSEGATPEQIRAAKALAPELVQQMTAETPEQTASGKLFNFGEVSEKLAWIMATIMLIATLSGILMPTTASAASIERSTSITTTDDEVASTKTPTPTATPTKEQPKLVATATPIVPETKTVYIPAGVRIREQAGTSATVLQVAPAPMSPEATGKVLTVEGYKWYEIKNPEYGKADAPELAWVAQVNGVTFETVQVAAGVGGGGNTESEKTPDQLFQEAVHAFGNIVVAVVNGPHGEVQAINSKNEVVGVYANGVWNKELPKTSAEVVSTTTEQAAATVMTYAEFSAKYPELVSPEMVADGKLLIVSAKNKMGNLGTIDIRNLQFRVVNSEPQIILPDGKVLFQKLEDNMDTSFNVWMQKMWTSKAGLFNIFVSTSYNDPNKKGHLLPDKQRHNLWGIYPTSPDLILSDADASKLALNPDKGTVDYLVQSGYLESSTPADSFIDPSEKMDEFVTKFFEILAGTTGQLPDRIQALQADGKTSAMINPALGVNFAIHGTPEGSDWIGEQVNALPTESYVVNANGQLTVYLLTNFETDPIEFIMDIQRSLEYILMKNNMNGSLNNKDIMGILSHPELSKYIFEYVIVNGKTFLANPFLLEQSSKPKVPTTLGVVK